MNTRAAAANRLSLRLATERPRLLALARRAVPTQTDAEDVVQRTMLKAALHAAGVEDPTRWRAWLGTILRRTVADWHRARRPEVPTDFTAHDVAAEQGPPPGNPCACSVRLLRTLRPAYAEVLERADLGGEPPEAVARALAISTVNLHVRLHRARRALRAQVMKTCGVTDLAPCLDCACDARGCCGSPRA